jgi:hypothetical protein
VDRTVRRTKSGWILGNHFSQVGFAICRNEVMGFFHIFGDARMPIWGVLAILSNFPLALFSRSGHRGFHFASLSMLILFVVIYSRLSKPINRLQTEAAKTGGRLDNARELQASWDRSVMIRTPLLVASLLPST